MPNASLINERQFFVGIGAQKAGSSWLGEYFRQHPQVGFSPLKSIHYFDQLYRSDLCGRFTLQAQQRLLELAQDVSEDSLRPAVIEQLRCLALRLEMPANSERYREYFELVVQPEHKVFGEISPSYSLLDATGFTAIRSMFPEGKVIFVLRDPVDRFWSHLRFEETRLGEGRFKAEDKIIKSLSNPQMYLRTDYRRTLQELFKVFPKRQVCIVFFERLMHEKTHGAELKKITDFLGIDFVEGNLQRKINESKVQKLPESCLPKMLSAFSHVYEFVSELMNDDVPEQWRVHLRHSSTSRVVGSD